MAAKKKQTKKASSTARKKKPASKKKAPKKEVMSVAEELQKPETMEEEMDDKSVPMEAAESEKPSSVDIPEDERSVVQSESEKAPEEDLFDDAMLDDAVDFGDDMSLDGDDGTEEKHDEPQGGGSDLDDSEFGYANPPKKKSHLYRNLALTFLGMSIIVILGIFYITFSEAKIYINATTGSFQEEFSQGVTEEENDLGISIIQAEGDLTEEFLASREETDIPATATGTAIIINDTDSGQPLVKNTRLQTPEGVLYRISEAVDVPARGQVEVQMYSDKEGKEYEIGPSEFIIPGLPQSLHSLIYARSETATTGGVEGTSKVTQENIDDAVNQVQSKLEEQLKNSLIEKLQDGQETLADTFVMKVLDENVDAKPGDEVERFHVTLKVKAAQVIGSIEDIEIIARQQVKQQILQDGQELVEFSKDDILYEVDTYDPEAGELLLKIVATGVGKVRDDASIFDKSKLSGLSPDEAVAYLQGFNAVESARVELGPFWVRRIPYLEDHIDIIFEE